MREVHARVPRGTGVTAMVDNTVTVALLNRAYTNSANLRPVLESLVEGQAAHACRWIGVHYPGHRNTVADALSRVFDSVPPALASWERSTQTPSLA